jgi:radical SAM protein with 4Fe4S-binding SPASM domain
MARGGQAPVSPEINEAARGNTDRTLVGLRHLSEAMGRMPGIIVTVTRCNALRMREVVDYLDGLGVALFRANQMGATASWNVHAAPRAEEWAQARQDILAEVAARRGRIMEFNLSQAVTKFVRSLLHGVSPFRAGVGCCDLRCPAGRQLLYFDQRGVAYPCPRANVTAGARIAHYAAADFEARWDERIGQLDAGMALPEECARCPAQLLCDYGCHAFNDAQGNFFEVNCDATKDYFRWATAHLEDVARVAAYLAWRDQLKAADDYDSLRPGTDLAPALVSGLADRLRRRLDERLSEPDLTPETLDRRYGWNHGLVPVAVIDRQRVSARPAEARRAPKGGGIPTGK